METLINSMKSFEGPGIESKRALLRQKGSGTRFRQRRGCAYDMTRKLLYGTVLDRPRKVIHVVRVDAILEFPEVDDIAERLRAHILSRYGEQRPNIVIVHGNTRESLRLFGDPHAVTRVRTALFNVALTFSPLNFDATDRS